MAEQVPGRYWPDYRAVWRWHFYASLFCMPFVVLLSITGAVYLFKPQIDRWQDRDFDNLNIDGEVATVAAQVKAALKALPGAIPKSYELPPTDNGAGRVIVHHQDQELRVYVHPLSTEVLYIRPEKDTFIRQVRSLHGQLWLGKNGSYLVELAASWTIIMIVTGLYLWWPRGSKGWGGIVYPRLRKGSRIFWRDIHSVTGVWISGCALFLLATGLPWATFWGSYFRSIRSVAEVAMPAQDWTLGGEQASTKSGEHGGHERKTNDKPSGRRGRNTPQMPEDLAAFDRVYATVFPLDLAYPVSLSPPAAGSSHWQAKSDAQNRTQRTTLKIDGSSGAIISREDFADRDFLDRLVAIGISAHEGQLFGWVNQLIGLLTALGLVVLSLSGYVMWWRRREPGTLGAPTARSIKRFSMGLLAIVLLLVAYLPLFGISMVGMLALERWLLSKFAPLRNWLGLPEEAVRSKL